MRRRARWRRSSARWNSISRSCSSTAPGRGVVDAVGIDNAEAAGQLVDHLVAQGHRRIVGLFGNTSSTGSSATTAMRRRWRGTGWRPTRVFAAAGRGRRGRADAPTRGGRAARRGDGVERADAARTLSRRPARRARDAARHRHRRVRQRDLDRTRRSGLTVIEQPVAESAGPRWICCSNACAGRTWRRARSCSPAGWWCEAPPALAGPPARPGPRRDLGHSIRPPQAASRRVGNDCVTKASRRSAAAASAVSKPGAPREGWRTMRAPRAAR